MLAWQQWPGQGDSVCFLHANTFLLSARFPQLSSGKKKAASVAVISSVLLKQISLIYRIVDCLKFFDGNVCLSFHYLCPFSSDRRLCWFYMKFSSLPNKTSTITFEKRFCIFQDFCVDKISKMIYISDLHCCSVFCTPTMTVQNDTMSKIVIWYIWGAWKKVITIKILMEAACPPCRILRCSIINI